MNSPINGGGGGGGDSTKLDFTYVKYSDGTLSSYDLTVLELTAIQQSGKSIVELSIGDPVIDVESDFTLRYLEKLTVGTGLTSMYYDSYYGAAGLTSVTFNNTSAMYGNWYIENGASFIQAYDSPLSIVAFKGKSIEDALSTDFFGLGKAYQTGTISITTLSSYIQDGYAVFEVQCTYDPCLLKGTLISLANGQTKCIEDITYDDELLVWNFDEGKLDFAKPLWIKKEDCINYMFENRFKSGKILLTTGRSKTGYGHRGFNTTRSRFTYFPSSVGDCFYTLDGDDELMSCEKKYGEFKYFNIITDKHFNLFANGILTSCSLNNLHKFNGMKFAKSQISYRKNIPGIAQKWFDGLRLEYQPINDSDLKSYVLNLERTMKKI